MPILSIDNGPDQGKTISLDSPNVVVTVGRQDGMTLQLSDPLTSSRHCRIVKTGNALIVEDLHSTNGVFVNGERMTQSALKAEDIIQVGETYISVLASGLSKGTKSKRALEIAGYLIDERIGVGGMGVVYRARQVSLDREVALKVLAQKYVTDPQLIKRFLQEGRAAGQLTHSNVVQVHDVGEDKGVYYICMEYVGGGNLNQLLREQGRLAVDTAVSITRDIARALEYAETKKLVHCDIKPENIMLTEDGMSKLADLGIARRLSDPQKQENEVLGSPHYMSPEQAQGRPLDHRSDLYSLGATLFRLLAGRTLFSGTTAREILKKQVVEAPPAIRELAPEVSPGLAALLAKLLEKKPEDRYQSAAELLSAFSDLEKERPQAEVAEETARPGSGMNRPLRRIGPPIVSTTSRVRRQRGPSAAAFLPFGLGAALLAFGVYAAMYHLMPDRGLQKLRRAEKFFQAGRYTEAQVALSGAGSTDSKVAAALEALRKDINQKIGEQEAERRFMMLWNQYERIKADGASKAQLLQRLERLMEQYGHIPKRQRVIQAEINRLP